ncbi:PREDICTED: phospholipase D LlSicTox-alphaIII2-like [Acropora digitifera]|uniref:phospholipase D LlSicTox-alphaIII2-like n=1 Tax=Acropora digitifera TaxID=70779 RepID=UPI00077AEDE7|nr:PREDICTED: phospholipase D LlSicTox-alphaIII2-like [Acropora digitifera]
MSQFSVYLVLGFSFGMVNRVISSRPVYNIAHMVNAVKQIDQWLGYGANALEVDVKFAYNGTPKHFYHGFPCDVGRDCERWAYIKNYINALRDRTIPTSSKFNSHLVLVMFDVKLKNNSALSKAGEKFVDAILIPLYQNNPTKMKVMISVPNLSLKDFIRSVLEQLNAKQQSIIQKIGFEISYETGKLEEPGEQEQALRDLGVAPGHAWLSKGKTSLWADLFLNELKARVKYRDNGNYFSKVYAWTVDKQTTALKYLNIGLDGIIANYPGRVNKAIAQFNENQQKVKLATLDDNPFRKY